VSATCDSINLVSIIDNTVGTHPLQKITVGEVVKAMILNALGFLYRTFYMHPIDVISEEELPDTNVYTSFVIYQIGKNEIIRDINPED